MREIASRTAVSGAFPGRSATRAHERHALAAHEVVADDSTDELGDAFLQQPAQAPVVLHPLLELGVLAVGRLEVGQRGKKLGVVVRVGRRLARDDREQLTLVDEVAVAAQRRARPQVVRETQALVLAGPRAHLDLARRLDPIEARGVAFGKQPAPGVVDVDHELGDQLVERAAALARDDASRGRRGRRIPVDVEAVVDAIDVVLAALAEAVLREPPQHAQFLRPWRVGRRRQVVRERVADRVEAQVGRDRRRAARASRAAPARRRGVVSTYERERRRRRALASA